MSTLYTEASKKFIVNFKSWVRAREVTLLATKLSALHRSIHTVEQVLNLRLKQQFKATWLFVCFSKHFLV